MNDDVAHLVSMAAELADLDADDQPALQLERARVHVQEHDAHVFPALPDLDEANVVAKVSAEYMALTEFLSIAANMGVRLVYIDAECLNVDQLTRDDDLDGLPIVERAGLQRVVARFGGQLIRLDVAFAYQNVWNLWSELSSFADPLLSPSSPCDSPLEDAARGCLTDERYEELVRQLADDPEFRALRRPSIRAAEGVPAVATMLERDSSMRSQVCATAQDAADRVRAAQDVKRHALQNRLAGLAHALGADERFRQGTNRRYVKANRRGIPHRVFRWLSVPADLARPRSVAGVLIVRRGKRRKFLLRRENREFLGPGRS
jgi:hypothetical protein